MSRPFKSEEYRNADFKYKRGDVVKCVCPDYPLYHNKIGTIEHVDIESKAWDEEDPNYYVLPLKVKLKMCGFMKIS